MSYTAEQIAFIDQLAPYVQQECIKRGYHFASPILAQASTESFKGKGLSRLASKYNNFFGMKAGSSWHGKTVNMQTGEEYFVGKITMIRDNFRSYDTVEDGVKGYFDFISTQRYANLKLATSPRDYLEKIKADGYATSSSYVATNMSRITGLNLTRFDNFDKIAPIMDDKPKTGNPYPEPTKNVRFNSKGNDARWLQYELNRYGYKLIVDGIIGQRSLDALKDFQLSHGLEPDEICGPKTKQALLG